MQLAIQMDDAWDLAFDLQPATTGEAEETSNNESQAEPDGTEQGSSENQPHSNEGGEGSSEFVQDSSDVQQTDFSPFDDIGD